MIRHLVFVKSKPVKLPPANLIGEGGEAEVYRIDANTALKIFKAPDHAAFAGNSPEAQAMRSAAAKRISEAQSKLRSVPAHLPGSVVTPQELAFDGNAPHAQVIGYTMPLIAGARTLRDLCQKNVRQAGRISDEEVVRAFIDLHDTVSHCHQSGLVIGDFNPFNVLLDSKQKAYLIDMDSMQFNGYGCTAFSPRYADPLICRRTGNQTTLCACPTPLTDWYAFALMLFECLMFVHPYGGVFRPANQAHRTVQDERPFKRISVFHQEVIYPLAARPLAALPSALLDYFQAVLHFDERGAFPIHFLQNLSFASGRAYLAHRATPQPVQKRAAVTADASPISARAVAGGTASAVVFQTDGTILTVCHQNGRLRYIFHDGNKFWREDGAAVLSGKLTRSMKFAISCQSTLVSNGDQVFLLLPGRQPRPISVERFRDAEPVFDANASCHYWVGGGRLWRSSASGPRLIDDVVSNQTRMWMGESFGFGFYSAGNLRRSFLFDNQTQTKIPVNLPEPIKLPIALRCHFTPEHLWLLLTTSHNATLTNHCCLIDRCGAVIAYHCAGETEDSWLNTINAKSAATVMTPQARRNLLFCATDDGLSVIEPKGSQLLPAFTFPHTAGQIPTDANLIYSSESLFFWTPSQISVLTGLGEGLNRLSTLTAQGVASC